MTNLSNSFAMFPGQGSQKVGMGHDLCSSKDIARAMFDHADRALGFSLSKVCFEGPIETLTETHYAQPAILTTSLISFFLAKDQFQDALSISCAAGHSLGEYSALVASGAIRFEDAVILVHKRGRYMQEAVPLGVGKMIAVLGKEIEVLQAAIDKVTEGVASIANNNAPGQIVVAGDEKGIDQFTSNLGPAKIIPLQVSAPFHCSLMKPAEEKLKKDLAVLQIQRPAFPVIANFTGSAVNEPEQIRDLLARQVCGQVKWVQSVEYALKTFAPSTAIEFGAGNVLTGLMKRINPAVPRKNIYSATEGE